MANAKRDQNNVPTLTAYDTTLLRNDVVLADPGAHALSVSDGSTGTDLGPQNAHKDGNSVPGLLAVSSVDGVTPVVIYTDGAGNLLIKST